MLRFLLMPVAAVGLLMATFTPSLACACCGTWQVTKVGKNDVLNMRSEPGARYRKVGSPVGIGLRAEEPPLRA